MHNLLAQAVFSPPVTLAAPEPDAAALAEATQALRERPRRMIGGTVAIREVDAGSCNGCELEIHALNNPFYDVERFGMHFVASPRHADLLLVTGPVACNMRQGLERTYAATPAPNWVVAVGDCACSGGVFKGSYACVGAVKDVVPVDVHIPGCPPTPTDLLKGFLALLKAIEENPPGRR
ncbi:MAG: NADH-quinone oxidoreductase subunit NuoB [Magnetococcales bacterium]|nr:NADH-quinone oxidoreductase subunit NuoB [Magnetococcales bacterium]